MSTHPLAGQRAPRSMLVDVPRLVSAYYVLAPTASQAVAFGTSGHRGTSVDATFNEEHVAAICQAVVDFRTTRGIAGPLFLGADTHALSEPALTTALEVLAANGVRVVVSSRSVAGGDAGGSAAGGADAGGWSYGRRLLPVPTPVISHSILTHNDGANFSAWLAASSAA
ncbi:MAG TPA: hypothetical protein VFN03_00025, partial [Trueperaceae bacterium]|nr:hypothetical protein [Trueperaceae bacterium]